MLSVKQMSSFDLSFIIDLRQSHKIQVSIEVLERVFIQVCHSQRCGMFIAQTILLLTQQVVFGKIIVQSCM